MHITLQRYHAYSPTEISCILPYIDIMHITLQRYHAYNPTELYVLTFSTIQSARLVSAIFIANIRVSGPA